MIGFLVAIFVLCVILWIINASGWMSAPPPFIWGANIVILIILVFMALHIGGINLAGYW